MRKTLLFLLILTLGVSQAFAQQEGAIPKKMPPKVEEVVSDLSAAQKRQLNTIREERKKRIDELNKQKESVQDSIHLFLNRDGDQSATLYRLFEREATIRTTIAKEMYSARLRIDAVLTADQRALMRKSSKAHGSRPSRERARAHGVGSSK